MVHSIANTLNLVQEHFSVGLVSADAFSLASSVAGQLPAALTNRVYLECRLGEDASRIDFIVGVRNRGREILAGENPVISLGRDLRRQGVWSRLAEFCRQWSSPGSILHAGVERIWLEFDLDAGVGSQPRLVPGIFVDFCHRQERSTKRNHYTLLEACLQALAWEDTDGRIRQRLQSCAMKVPEGCWVPYLGIFPSRQEERVRLCVRGLGQGAPEYLQAIGWSGAVDELRRSMASLARVWPGAEGGQAAVLHVDIGRRIGPTLGLEYAFSPQPQVRGRFPEAPFLDHLVGEGLCTAVKHQGLVDWPGHSICTLPHEIWPSWVVRRINHVKLIFDEHLSEAKGYLCLHHHLHTRRKSHPGTI